jgi:hypothetical protein
MEQIACSRSQELQRILCSLVEVSQHPLGVPRGLLQDVVAMPASNHLGSAPPSTKQH